MNPMQYSLDDFWFSNIVFLVLMFGTIGFFRAGVIRKGFELPRGRGRWILAGGIKIYQGNEAFLWGLVFSTIFGMFALAVFEVTLAKSSYPSQEYLRFGVLSLVSYFLVVGFMKFEDKFNAQFDKKTQKALKAQKK